MGGSLQLPDTEAEAQNPASPGTVQEAMQSTSPANETAATRMARSDGLWATNVNPTEHASARPAPVVRSLLRARSAQERGSTFIPATPIFRQDPICPAAVLENISAESVDVQFRVNPEGKVY